MSQQLAEFVFGFEIHLEILLETDTGNCFLALRDIEQNGMPFTCDGNPTARLLLAFEKQIAVYRSNAPDILMCIRHNALRAELDSFERAGKLAVNTFCRMRKTDIHPVLSSSQGFVQRMRGYPQL